MTKDVSNIDFPVVFSVYSGTLFGYLCAPGEQDTDKRFVPSDEIKCTRVDYKLTAYIAWLFLLLSLAVYIVKEIITISLSIRQRYFYKWETYRNLATIVTIVLVVHKGSPTTTHLKLQRWQYHVAAGACLLLWLEMLMLVGKIPKFGKYIHMFK